MQTDVNAVSRIRVRSCTALPRTILVVSVAQRRAKHKLSNSITTCRFTHGMVLHAQAASGKIIEMPARDASVAYSRIAVLSAHLTATATNSWELAISRSVNIYRFLTLRHLYHSFAS